MKKSKTVDQPKLEELILSKHANKATIDIYKYQLANGDIVLHNGDLLVACNAASSTTKCKVCHIKPECYDSAKLGQYIKCNGIVFRKKEHTLKLKQEVKKCITYK